MLEIFLALESYKYLALFAGVLVGGEWVLIPVMYLVFSGVFSAEAVIITTLAASLSADSIWYGVGRILSHYGSSWWQRKPFLRQAGQRAKDLLERHGKRLVVIVKFIYGPRTLIHIAFGIIRLPYAMYML